MFFFIIGIQFPKVGGRAFFLLKKSLSTHFFLEITYHEPPPLRPRDIHVLLRNTVNCQHRQCHPTKKQTNICRWRRAPCCNTLSSRRLASISSRFCVSSEGHKPGNNGEVRVACTCVVRVCASVRARVIDETSEPIFSLPIEFVMH